MPGLASRRNDFYGGKGQYWLTSARTVRTRKGFHLEVLQYLNLSTLLPVELDQPDLACIEVMNEVFFS